MTFESLGLPAGLLDAVTRAGYTTPTPIQAGTIPPLMQGRDVLGQAATGTGKTAAFALPILSALKPGHMKPFETGALVLVPTRELALQVTESMRKYSDAMGVTVLAIYGGQEFGAQLRPMKRGVDVVVATPGRAIDHLKRKTLKLDKVRTVVLDEADEMLDMGFAEDLEVLLSALPAERQVALFSATMPSRILKIAERQMKNPVRVSIARATTHGEGQKIRQVAYVVPRRAKIEALLRVLEVEQPTSALVFCRTRADVDELATVLDEKGLATEALHGGLSQDQRDRVMKKFKSGAVKYVVATDVAARGIHVDNLSHVINADVPTSPEVYVHRIGRTGRAGREGVAITFAEPGEVRLIRGLERASGGRLQQLPVPTADQVKSKKFKATQKLISEAMSAGASAVVQQWVASLSADDLPVMAAAAVELLHRAMHNEAPGDATVGHQPADVAQTIEAQPRPSAGRRPTARPSAVRGEDADRQASGPRTSAERQSPSPESDVNPKPSAERRASSHRASTEPLPKPSAERRTPTHRGEEGASKPSAERRAPAHRAEREGPRASAERKAHRPHSAEALPPPRASDERRGPPRASAERIVRSDKGPRFDATGAPKFARAEGASRPFTRFPSEARPGRRDGGPKAPSADVVTLFVGAGSQAGIRAGDLVGAIANEAGLHSKQIGPIDIRESFSLVGVPSVAAEAVIDALSNSKLRGRRVKVRRER